MYLKLDAITVQIENKESFFSSIIIIFKLKNRTVIKLKFALFKVELVSKRCHTLPVSYTLAHIHNLSCQKVATSQINNGPVRNFHVNESIFCSSIKNQERKLQV